MTTARPDQQDSDATVGHNADNEPNAHRPARRRQHKVDTSSRQIKQENQYLSRRHVSTRRVNDQVHSPAENQVTHENPVSSPTLNDKIRKRKGV